MPVHLNKTNRWIKNLEVFIGEWNVEISSMSFRADKNEMVRGSARFEWFEQSFLIQRFEVPNSEFPAATFIIGPDDTSEQYCALYTDSRGVSRVYQMSLNEQAWNLWRTAPGFSQRFSAVFKNDKKQISAKWEKSVDGINWDHDFDLTYTRLK